MAIWGNKRLLVDRWSELPVVNETRISSIYGRMDTAFRTDQLLVDAYDKKPDYYLLCSEDRNKDNIKVKKLPKELAALFGQQQVGSNKVYVTRLWFRTSCSGNGSFTDSTASLTGGCGATTRSISYFRTKRWENAWDGAVFEGEPFAKKIEAVFGKKFKVEELPEYYDVEYDSSYIRKEGALNYPDVKLESWRWLYGRPYVSNNYDKGFPDRRNIRVWFEPWQAHLYLQAVEPQEGDEGLIEVTFPHSHAKKGDQFCHIGEWAESKKEDPNGIIRWTVLKVNKKEHWSYHMAAVINEKIQFKRQTHNLFYRLMSISRV